MGDGLAGTGLRGALVRGTKCSSCVGSCGTDCASIVGRHARRFVGNEVFVHRGERFVRRAYCVSWANTYLLCVVRIVGVDSGGILWEDRFKSKLF